MRFNTTIAGRYGNADGAIEIDGKEIVVFRKSFFVRTFFGALGTALASGKEVGRFTRNEIEFYEIRERAFKSIVWIRFRDGEEFSFTLKDIELTTAFKTFMED